MAASFVDKAKISVRSGTGGNGAVAFHREKYIAAGGPDGGDGGSGGSIILEGDGNMSTLVAFPYKRQDVAGRGLEDLRARHTAGGGHGHRAHAAG